MDEEGIRQRTRSSDQAADGLSKSKKSKSMNLQKEARPSRMLAQNSGCQFSDDDLGSPNFVHSNVQGHLGAVVEI